MKFDLCAIWAASDPQSEPDHTSAVPGAGWIVVWRDHLRPRHRLLAEDEYTVLAALAVGHPLAHAAAAVPGKDEQAHGAAVGGWLTGWLLDGLFSGWKLAAAA